MELHTEKSTHNLGSSRGSSRGSARGSARCSARMTSSLLMLMLNMPSSQMEKLSRSGCSFITEPSPDYQDAKSRVIAHTKTGADLKPRCLVS
jgi:hypothetical protein